MAKEIEPASEPKGDATPESPTPERGEHDWNKNIDGCDADTQREDEMRTSFSFTDNYAEGPEFSGRINSERHLDEKTGKRNEFKPLEGSITRTVEQVKSA